MSQVQRKIPDLASRIEEISVKTWRKIRRRVNRANKEFYQNPSDRFNRVFRYEKSIPSLVEIQILCEELEIEFSDLVNPSYSLAEHDLNRTKKGMQNLASKYGLKIYS